MIFNKLLKWFSISYWNFEQEIQKVFCEILRCKSAVHHVAKQLIPQSLHCRSAVDCCPVEGQHWSKLTCVPTDMSIYAQHMCLWMTVVASICAKSFEYVCISFWFKFWFCSCKHFSIWIEEQWANIEKASQTQETQIGSGAFFWLHQYFFKWWWCVGSYCRSISTCFGSCSWRAWSLT